MDHLSRRSFLTRTVLVVAGVTAAGPKRLLALVQALAPHQAKRHVTELEWGDLEPSFVAMIQQRVQRQADMFNATAHVRFSSDAPALILRFADRETRLTTSSAMVSLINAPALTPDARSSALVREVDYLTQKCLLDIQKRRVGDAPVWSDKSTVPPSALTGGIIG